MPRGRKKTVIAVETEIKPLEIDKAVYDRAKQCALSDDQIKTFATQEDLIKYLDGLKIETNPEYKPKTELKPAKVIAKEELPVIIPVHKDLLHNELDTCQRIERMLNIKYNSPGTTKITKTIVYEIGKRNLAVAEYKVEYKVNGD